MNRIVQEMMDYIEKTLEGWSHLLFIYCGLVGAYVAILLNNAVAYYSSVGNADDYRTALICALVSFLFGMSSYLDIQGLARQFSHMEQRVGLIRETVTGEKHKQFPKLGWSEALMIFTLILSGILVAYSIYRYTMALNLLLKP